MKFSKKSNHSRPNPGSEVTVLLHLPEAGGLKLHSFQVVIFHSSYCTGPVAKLNFCFISVLYSLPDYLHGIPDQ